ncbi:HemK methyltransferase member 2 [Kappamyces sp. JEL0680]|nr:HemK methyltransferase member 2 [Kappamyces sp. JEL0680]
MAHAHQHFIPQLPTPKLPHPKHLYEQVYEPAEDSFVLLDGLEMDLPALRSLCPLTILEIGTGSGIALTFLSLLFPQAMSLGIDINPVACRASLDTARANDTVFDVLNTNLLSGLARRASWDVILFNPPYVVTPQEEIDEQKVGLHNAWAGGHDGRGVVDRLLPLVDSHLAANGRFYLIAVNENGINDLRSAMDGRGFAMTVVLYRVCGWEGLSLLCFTRKIHGADC